MRPLLQALERSGFALSSAQRICAESVRIATPSANAALDAAISRNRRVTPEIQQAMGEVGRVQQECQQSMLAHIYEISEQMDPSSGERYLKMMKQRIIQPGLPSNTAVSQ